jgi:hypothetical protein
MNRLGSIPSCCKPLVESIMCKVTPQEWAFSWRNHFPKGNLRGTYFGSTLLGGQYPCENLSKKILFFSLCYPLGIMEKNLNFFNIGKSRECTLEWALLGVIPSPNNLLGELIMDLECTRQWGLSSMPFHILANYPFMSPIYGHY